MLTNASGKGYVRRQTQMLSTSPIPGSRFGCVCCLAGAQVEAIIEGVGFSCALCRRSWLIVKRLIVSGLLR